MKHFTVLFIAPVDVLEKWMQTPEAERNEAVAKMRTEWDVWMAAHKDSILNTIGLGKTKRVSAAGVEDVRNGIMLSSYVQGESAEAVAEMYKDHPHFGVPGATIEIMEARQM